MALSVGNTYELDVANVYSDKDSFICTVPVGSFPKGASPFEVVAMMGNVWEWT